MVEYGWHKTKEIKEFPLEREATPEKVEGTWYDSMIRVIIELALGLIVMIWMILTSFIF